MTEITAEALSSYLSGRLVEDDVTVSDVEEHVEGWSRDTVSFSASWRTEGRPVERRLVVRAESDEQANADIQLYGDIEAEYHVMDAVQSADVPVPKTYWYEPDDSILGGRFFLVDYVPGEAPITWSPTWREQLYAAWESPERSLPHQFVDAAAGIHSVDPATVAGIDDVPAEEVPLREIERWEALFQRTALVDEPLMWETFDWLRENQPEVPETTLVHGDFRIGNMLVEDGEITGVLDWEFGAAGDPLFDLGYASTRYYAGKLTSEIERPELACALLERDWFYDEYEKRTGRVVDRDRVQFWRVLSLALIVTMCTGGMRRYHDGESDDVRNVWFQYMLPGLLEDMLDHVRSERF